MPDEPIYTITELADLAGVTPRTVRYYLSQGLLPSAGQTGPGTRYSESHLARLRVIRGLQAEHLPLAEIRKRLSEVDDDEVVTLAEQGAPPPPADSALDYVRSILRETHSPNGPGLMRASMSAKPSSLASASVPAPASPPAPTSAERLGESLHSAAKPGDRSQWERIVLATDVELHVRRPLGRTQNKRVDRLVTIARELLEEDPS